MLDTSEDMVVMVDMVDMVDTDMEVMEVMAAMEAIMAEDTERDLLMLSLRLMLLLVMESALLLMAMLPPLLPMLLLLPSPSDMVDMAMELESGRDLLMLSPRLMLLSSEVTESALLLMAMLPPLLPMLLLLPSPSDMVDMVMELESGRDLLMLRLMPMPDTLEDMAVMVDTADMDMVDTDMEAMEAMEAMAVMDMAEDTERDLLMLRLTLPSSTDLTAMLPPLLPTDMLSLPPLSDPTPSLLTELEDMDMELMDLTGNSSPSHSTNQYSNSKDDVKSPNVDVNVPLTFFSAFKFNLTSRKNKFT